jgi:GTP-binding protein LepA
VLEAIVRLIPPPSGDVEAPLKALIFDSHYDAYKGVVAYIRVVEGRVQQNEMIRMMATGITVKPVEIGVFSPDMRP